MKKEIILIIDLLIIQNGYCALLKEFLLLLYL